MRCGMALLLTAVAASTGCSLTVPIQYRPTTWMDVNRFAGKLPLCDELKVLIEPVSDERIDRDLIGENSERWEIPILSEGTSPPVFVHRILKEKFVGAGFTLVSDPTEATRVVSVKLLRFWVQETEEYRGEVRALVTVREPNGTALCHLLLGGSSEREGFSLWKSLYQSVLSDSTIYLAENILSNGSFQASMDLQ